MWWSVKRRSYCSKNYWSVMSVAIRNLKFTILFVSINTFLILLINTILSVTNLVRTKWSNLKKSNKIRSSTILPYSAKANDRLSIFVLYYCRLPREDEVYLVSSVFGTLCGIMCHHRSIWFMMISQAYRLYWLWSQVCVVVLINTVASLETSYGGGMIHVCVGFMSRFDSRSSMVF